MGRGRVGHFPTALTHEEPQERETENGGVLALYTHPETTFRWLDPFRICDHDRFRKQVYPDLNLSDGCPLGAKIPRRHFELRASVRTYDPGSIRVTWGGVELQGFAEGSFVESTYVPEPAPLNAFQQSVGNYAADDAENVIELHEVLKATAKNVAGKITFTLLATAPNTEALDAIQEAIDEGTKPVPVGQEWTFDASDLDQT